MLDRLGLDLVSFTSKSSLSDFPAPMLLLCVSA